MRISQSAMIHALGLVLKLRRRDAQAVLSAFTEAIQQAISFGYESRTDGAGDRPRDCFC
jgi:hypothetical protein